MNLVNLKSCFQQRLVKMAEEAISRNI